MWRSPERMTRLCSCCTTSANRATSFRKLKSKYVNLVILTILSPPPHLDNDGVHFWIFINTNFHKRCVVKKEKSAYKLCHQNYHLMQEDAVTLPSFVFLLSQLETELLKQP